MVEHVGFFMAPASEDEEVEELGEAFEEDNDEWHAVESEMLGRG